jgi:hypothetical protein
MRMRVIGIIAAVVLSLLFVPAAAAAAVLFALQSQIYSAATYEKLLADNGIYERAPDLMVDMMLHEERNSSSPGVIASLGLPEEKIRRILTEIMPPEILKDTIEPAVGQIVAFARGDGSDVTFEVAGLKDAVLQNFPAALAIAQDGLPECTPQQLEARAAEHFKCLPPASINGELGRRALATLETTLSQTADSQTWPLENGSSEFTPEKRRHARLGMLLSPAAPLVIYLLIALFAARSRSAALVWFAVPALIAGLVAAATGLIAGRLFPQILTREMRIDTAPDSDPVRAVFAELTLDLAASVSGGIMVAGIVLALTAVAALLAAAADRKSAAPPESGYY